MKKIFYLLIGLSFIVGVTLGTSTNVIAQQASIPSWVKNAALWWAQGQISDAEYLKSIQWLVDNGLINLPSQSSSSQSTQNTTPSSITTSTSDDALSITERLDGQSAMNKMQQISNAYNTISNSDKLERTNRSASQSQFALEISFSGSWQGAISDGSSIVSINGDGSSIIPFQCPQIIGYAYNTNIQKMTQDGQLIIAILKNGMIIDAGKTTSPYGLVALTGNCDNPDVADNLKKITG